MKVDIYRNLRTGTWSVRSRETEDYGKVVDHPTTIQVRDVSFVVQPAGLQKALDVQQKQVHAFVRGTLDTTQKPQGSGTKFTYNPFKGSKFVCTSTQRVLKTAKLVVLGRRGKAVAYDVTFES